MKQPELGIKISEIRNQKKFTQKELSEFSSVDIRTIQRIESGEVIPRISTMKLIANALSCDLDIFISKNQDNANYLSPKLLFALFVLGVIYFASWVLFCPILPQNSFLLSINLLLGFVYTLTGVFFYFAFYNLGKSHNNRVLWISSIIIMICIPLFLITLLVSSEFSFATHASQLIVITSGINSIIFGIGLYKVKNHLMNLYKVTGVLQILIAPFFIISLPILNIIGCWLSIPFILLLLSIVYLEFLESKKQYFSIVA